MRRVPSSSSGPTACSTSEHELCDEGRRQEGSMTHSLGRRDILVEEREERGLFLDDNRAAMSSGKVCGGLHRRDSCAGVQQRVNVDNGGALCYVTIRCLNKVKWVGLRRTTMWPPQPSCAHWYDMSTIRVYHAARSVLAEGVNLIEALQVQFRQ